jgi:hypothetical protein
MFSHLSHAGGAEIVPRHRVETALYVADSQRDFPACGAGHGADDEG